MQGPQLRPIQPPVEPARLAPRQNIPHYQSSSIKEKVFPPSQVLDSMPVKTSNAQERQPFAAPPPSKLPTSRLDNQRSALLSLFKSPKPIAAEVSRTPGHAIPSDPELANDSVPLKSFVDARLPTGGTPLTLGGKFANPQPVNANADTIGDRKIPRQSNMFIPSQVSRRSSDTTPTLTTRPTAHQTKLLDMFKTPTTKPETKELASADAAELSASPRAHRSRNPSIAAAMNAASVSPTKGPKLGQIKIQKRPQADAAPVSATVTGPLNGSHFSTTKISAQEVSKKVSPVRILARPARSKVDTVSQPPPPVMNKIESEPAKVEQPSTPDLKAKDGPPKPFHPTILRRPGASSDLTVPSPMSPLPSPRHKVGVTKDTRVSLAEQKRSLLSLFTKPASPSPVDSPSNGVIDGAASTLVSPLEKPSVPPVSNMNNFLSNQSHPASIAEVFNSSSLQQKQPQQEQQQDPIEQLEKPRKKFYAPDRMPQASTDRSQSTGVPDPENNNARAAAPVPQTSTITPASQQYLLGFLNGLK